MPVNLTFWFSSIHHFTEFTCEKNTIGKESTQNVKRKDEFKVPAEEKKKFALALHYLIEWWNQRAIISVLLDNLLVDVLT